MIDKETAIDFALWLRKVDTVENCEEWFGFTDEDMLNYYLENVRTRKQN